MMANQKPDKNNAVDIQAHLNSLLSDEDNESLLQPKAGTENKSKRYFRRQKRTKQAERLTKSLSPANERNHLFAHEWDALKAVGILGVAAGILIYLLSPLNQIQTFDVQGNQDLSDKSVLASAGLLTGQPVWTMLTQEKYFSDLAVTNNPQIKNMTLTLEPNNRLRVKVDEIVKVGYVKAGQQYFPILENGTMLKSGVTKQLVGGLPLYDGFTSGKQLSLTLAEFGKLSPALRHAVSEIVWAPNKQNQQRLILFMNDGNEVLVSANQLAQKMKYYPGMVAQLDTTGRADLQVGAFFTPFGQ